MMRWYFASTAMFFNLWPSMDQCPAVPNPISRGSTTGRAVIDRRTIHIPDLTAVSEEEFPVSKIYYRDMGDRTTLATPLLREGVSIGAILIRRREVRPFTDKTHQIVRDLCISSCHCDRERPAVQRDCRSATQNCARPWSIRRRRPKCSASSAARRRTCSRSLMPSSRVLLGFVGLMMWCCDCAKVTCWQHALILVPFPSRFDRTQFG